MRLGYFSNYFNIILCMYLRCNKVTSSSSEMMQSPTAKLEFHNQSFLIHLKFCISSSILSLSSLLQSVSHLKKAGKLFLKYSFAKPKRKDLVTIKSQIPSRDFLTVSRKCLQQLFFKSKYGHSYHEDIKEFGIEATAVRYSQKQLFLLQKFVKFLEKTSNFYKVVGQKPKNIINVNVFLDVFLGILQNSVSSVCQ